MTVCPALERALDLTTQGPLVLLFGFPTSAALRKVGVVALISWLRDRRVRNAAVLAAWAVVAAETQNRSLPAERLAALLVARLAKG